MWSEYHLTSQGLLILHVIVTRQPFTEQIKTTVNIQSVVWECSETLFFPPGRADDSLRSCRGSWGVSGQEHVPQKRLQGKDLNRAHVYYSDISHIVCDVVTSVSTCRFLSISEGTQRKGILCPLELLLEFLLPLELLLVSRSHTRLFCWI